MQRAALTASALVVCLGVAHAARAEGPRTHTFARISVGGAYMRNENGVDRPQSGAGLATQIDLGVRLLSMLRLHGTFILDHAFDTDFSYTDDFADPLRVFGIGAGATANWRSLELGLSAGVQGTSYMNDREPQDGPVGADAGYFVSGSLGYVLRQMDPLTFGLHAFARFHAASDDYLGTRFSPKGYQVGAMLSVSFDGSPLL